MKRSVSRCVTTRSVGKIKEQKRQVDAVPVGAWLVSGPHPDDLPRSGSKIRRLDNAWHSACTGFAAGSRQIVRMRPRHKPRSYTEKWNSGDGCTNQKAKSVGSRPRCSSCARTAVMDGLQTKPSRTIQIQPIHTPPQRHPKKHLESPSPQGVEIRDDATQRLRPLLKTNEQKHHQRQHR